MDRSVKERLIGAAVLVVLGAWLIPLVLDGPATPEPSAPAADLLRLPVPEQSTGEAAPMRRAQTVELDVTRDEHDGPLPLPVEPAAGSPNLAVPAADAARHEPHADARAETAIANAKHEVPISEASSSEVSTKGAEGAAGGETWMVQLGSFGELENARRQADRLATFGYSPSISDYTMSGRLMYRVRVGPVATRARAEAMASALSAHGFVAQPVPR